MRTNEDIRIDKEKGVMTMTPRMHLKFIKEESLDDPENIAVNMPNIALIVSTSYIRRCTYKFIVLQVKPELWNSGSAFTRLPRFGRVVSLL